MTIADLIVVGGSGITGAGVGVSEVVSAGVDVIGEAKLPTCGNPVSGGVGVGGVGSGFGSSEPPLEGGCISIMFLRYTAYD